MDLDQHQCSSLFATVAEVIASISAEKLCYPEGSTQASNAQTILSFDVTACRRERVKAGNRWRDELNFSIQPPPSPPSFPSLADFPRFKKHHTDTEVKERKGASSAST